MNKTRLHLNELAATIAGIGIVLNIAIMHFEHGKRSHEAAIQMLAPILFYAFSAWLWRCARAQARKEAGLPYATVDRRKRLAGGK